MIALASAAAATAAATGSFSFTSDQPNTTWTCAVDGRTPTPCTSPFTTNGLSAGNHTVTIQGSFMVAGTTTTAAFSYSPANPVTGQAVRFDGTASTCAAAPCTYNWVDLADNGQFATTPTFAFTFHHTGTKEVQLTVTDAQGHTARVEHDVTVGSPAAGSPAPGGVNCAGPDGSGNPDYAAMDACGFPSPHTTGVPAGTTLTPSGSITANTAGQVISDLKVTGSIQVNASNVTIENSEITSNSSTGGVRIGPGVSGVVVKNDTIHGTDDSASGNLQAAVYNTNYSDSTNAVTVDHVDFYDGQRILHGPGTLENSFCLDTVAVSGAHYECVYEGGGGVVINHNTLLVGFTQTAAVFISTDFAALQDAQITNNLLAGGGYAIYGDATNEHNYGIRSETITGNHFSRLYYGNGGYYGVCDDQYLPSAATWSGNVWDDTGAIVSP